jgi:SWI/SNF-related matrix-associated actin-dependent regulator of chromatin subfamily A3
VTGTPIQNRLTDLGTLLHFLRVHPFDDSGFFEQEFLRPWRKGSDPSVLDKLRSLVRYVTLRRSKEVLHLLPREDHVRRLAFSMAEQEFYTTAKSRTCDALPELLDGAVASKTNYFNELAWINHLRITCNHGVARAHSSPRPAGSLSTPSPASGEEYDTIVTCELLVENENVLTGSSGLELLECLSLQSQETSSQNDKIYSRTWNSPGTPTTPDKQPLDIPSDRRSSIAGSPVSSGWTSPYSSSATAYRLISTKIAKLIQDLSEDCGGEKRYGSRMLPTSPADFHSVVFSFWKTTLDLVAPALSAAGISVVRLLGKLNKRQRNKSLQDFRTKPDVQVLLATISVAGFGYDCIAGFKRGSFC